MAKKGDELKFYVLKRQDLNPGSFCPNGNQQYTAKFVSDDKVEVFASFVVFGGNCSKPSSLSSLKKSKSEVLKTFQNTVGDEDICEILDCKKSTFKNIPLDKAFAAMKKKSDQAGPVQQKKAKESSK